MNPFSKLVLILSGFFRFSLRALIRSHKIKKGDGRLRFYKGSAVKFGKGAKINITKGYFEFNKKWINNDPFHSLFVMHKNAEVVIKDSFSIYSGSTVYVNQNAVLSLGSGYINSRCNISCFSKIEIGSNVVISENVSIRDSDNHEIDGSSMSKTLPVKIGDHVWIGMNVTILKGVEIGTGAVIAAGSVVNKNIPSGCMAGGVPAKVIKENIIWK